MATIARTPPTAPAGVSTTVGIERLTKTFPGVGGAAAAVAVDAVSLEIGAGELFFLLGPSGCGKTTLLRMVAGFIDPTGGRVTFADGAGVRDVTYLPPNKRNTGMVFQSYALWPHMSVEANVAFGLEMRKVGGAERKARVAEALAAVRMEEYAARKPTQLSGGQQQRVALARALVIRPSVLLLDEPLSNLDAKLRLELRSEIRRVCKATGITTVYVTHDQKEALSMADRVAIMQRGKVVQVGTPEGLYRRPGSAFVAEFLGETNLIPGTVVGVDDRGVTVRTAAGTVRGTGAAGASFAVGAPVLASIRPEAFGTRHPQGADTENTLRGRVTDTVYLGEVAQLVVDVEGIAVRVSVLNPAAARREDAAMELAVNVEDVVILMPERG